MTAKKHLHDPVESTPENEIFTFFLFMYKYGYFIALEF